MTDGLGHSAARGALFTMGAQGARILLQIVSVVVLSRLLSPHDYGLLTIGLVVVGIGEIFRDFGLTAASVQADTLSREQRDNLFWINTAIGVVLAAIVFALAWVLAGATGEDDLLVVVQCLAPVFVFNGAATQYRAQLMRALRFKALAFADILSALLALIVAVVLALSGWGYGALVAQQLVSAGALLLLLVLLGRWLPRWYSRSAPIRGIVAFGWNLVATNLLTYAAGQLDTVLVATNYGPSVLGIYNRAYQLVLTPLNQIRSPLTTVALPVLSRIQKDERRFAAFVTSAQLALGYGLGIPLLMLAGMAEPVVDVMLGPQWADAAPILRLFAVAGVLTTLAFVGYWVYLARGLGKQLFRYSLLSTAIRVVCIVAGSFFGVIGIAVGFALAPAIAWPVSLYVLSRVTSVPVPALYAGAARILVLASAAGAASWLASASVRDLGSGVSIAVGLLAGAAVCALGLVVPMVRRDARALRGFVRLMLRRSTPGSATVQD